MSSYQGNQFLFIVQRREVLAIYPAFKRSSSFTIVQGGVIQLCPLSMWLVASYLVRRKGSDTSLQQGFTRPGRIPTYSITFIAVQWNNSYYYIVQQFGGGEGGGGFGGVPDKSPNSCEFTCFLQLNRDHICPYPGRNVGSFSGSIYTDKKENQIFSYIRKFRMEQLQSHI